MTIDGRLGGPDVREFEVTSKGNAWEFCLGSNAKTARCHRIGKALPQLFIVFDDQKFVCKRLAWK